LSVKKSFSFFIAIVAISVTGVLFFSIDSSTFDVLAKANPSLLVACLLLVILGWCLDSLKFICLAKAVGEHLSFKHTLATVWINYFGCAITPMQSGGGPFQIYVLYKYGVTVGKSVAITLVRTIQIIFLLATIVPFALIAEPEFIQKHYMLKWFVVYVIVFLALTVFVLIVSVWRPKWLKKCGSWLLLRMRWLGIIKPKLFLRAARRVNREIDNYNNDIKLFLSSGRNWFLLSFIVACVHLLVYMSIMPCLIIAVGFHVKYLQCILAESLFIFLLYFVPTPGASGAAEGGAAAVFGLFVPWNMAGVMAVTWRLISEYTGIAVGTFMAVKLLGWGGADEVMKEDNARFNENAK